MIRNWLQTMMFAIVFYNQQISFAQLSTTYQNPFSNQKAVAFADSTAKATLVQLSEKDKIGLLSGNKRYKFKSTLSFIFTGHMANVTMTNTKIKNLPPFVMTDGPRGVTAHPQTNFPAPITRASTWNLELEALVGLSMAQEAKYKGAIVLGAPCINILRHPSNGRAQESYGEDPFLVGEMGMATVTGIQSQGVMACVKHFALNSIENTRYHLDVKVDERTLHEVYLPHFKKCFDIGAATVMTAYNKVNGTYCSENQELLLHILRKQWNFKGFVQSDWSSAIRSTAPSILAQTDVEMPRANFYEYKKVKLALDNKALNIKDIEQSAYNILFTRYLINYTDTESKVEKPDLKKHQELALQTAIEGTVLLKNEQGILPLNVSKVKSILLVGRLANEENDGDKASSGVKTKVITPLQAFKEFALKSGIEIIHSESKDATELTKLAKQCDAVLVVSGLNYLDESEYISVKGEDRPNTDPIPSKQFIKAGKMGDRYNLSLDEAEIRLIQLVSNINKNTIVFLIGGSAIMMEAWKNDVQAILYSGYHGMNGALSMPKLLFGEKTPSGKLPFTIPANESQLPDFPKLPLSIEYGRYHGYTLMDKKTEIPAFPFGYGLSYTSFSITPYALSDSIFAEGDTLKITVSVKNTGNVDGAEVVQAYIHFNQESNIEQPVKLLKAFKKVFLKSGEFQMIELKIPMSELAYYQPQNKNWLLDKTTYSVEIANSSRDINASFLYFSIK
jgi:beta-glucosidase